MPDYQVLRDRSRCDAADDQPDGGYRHGKLHHRVQVVHLGRARVDHLRAAVGTIIVASPEFQRLLKDVGAKVVAHPSAGEIRAVGAR